MWQYLAGDLFVFLDSTLTMKGPINGQMLKVIIHLIQTFLKLFLIWIDTIPALYLTFSDLEQKNNTLHLTDPHMAIWKLGFTFLDIIDIIFVSSNPRSLEFKIQAYNTLYFKKNQPEIEIAQFCSLQVSLFQEYIHSICTKLDLCGHIDDMLESLFKYTPELYDALLILFLKFKLVIHDKEFSQGTLSNIFDFILHGVEEL